MKNCLVAQSGGPSAVINSSFMGVLDEALESKCFENIFAGLNGIEGILNEKLVNLSKLPYDDLKGLKYTPSSGLGSCRYKMKDYKKDSSEYDKLFEIFKKYEIEAFFYIGGNDSMDTVRALTEYTKEHNINNIKIMGVPKTIDNDLMETDHTPGYGSASKYIATTVLECYLDSSVYINNGIFIVEAMGRDTGWLTASAALAKINGKPVADFIYLPETAFSKLKFLEDVRKKFKEQNQVFIVASEGIRDENGEFIAKASSSAHDKFGHAQLGGVCGALKNLIIESGITSRVKTLELGVAQRAAIHCASATDIEEAYSVGREAVKYSVQGFSGYMVGIRRLQSTPYESDTVLVDPSKVANHVKYFPKEWITPEGNWVTEEALEYISPLIQGTSQIPLENGLPKFAILKK
jgi:ATP-dependent phosphofructokinase / diphosphate-dependent phosphofructokinase